MTSLGWSRPAALITAELKTQLITYIGWLAERSPGTGKQFTSKVWQGNYSDGGVN